MIKVRVTITGTMELSPDWYEEDEDPLEVERKNIDQFSLDGYLGDLLDNVEVTLERLSDESV